MAALVALSVPPLLRALRPSQWIKNTLVVAAPGAAAALDERSIIADSIVAFFVFCAAASSTYLINDLNDREADREHPLKMHRPIAAGSVSQSTALAAALVLGGAAIIGGSIHTPLLGALVAFYLLVTCAYSIRLKHLPWVELVFVTSGFLLRAAGGGVATDVPLTGWFYLVVGAGALLLVTAKRIGELRAAYNGQTRLVLRHYRVQELRLLLIGAGAVALASYVLWATAEADARSASPGWLWLSIAPFAIAIWRYVVLGSRGDGEDPIRRLLVDPIMVGAGVGWLAVYAIGLQA